MDDYDFALPEANIAQSPLPERDAARLMVLERSSGQILEAGRNHWVRDLPAWLRRGDLIVVNATRVRSAKLVGQKASGGAAEALLLGPEASTLDPKVRQFRALIKCTGRLREGLRLRFGNDLDLNATVTALHERGEVSLEFDSRQDPYAFGEAPLPPYIRRQRGEAAERVGANDLDRYQTVYAREPGAIAAPTAGLHFTEALFRRLREGGVKIAEVILHVGAGTFRPLDAKAITTGLLHAESFVLPDETVKAIEETRRSGGRVIAVGTTTARVLESQASAEGALIPGSGTTDLFIRPGGKPFRVLDGLLTNFHLPRSSLLLLVAEFLGRGPLMEAYAHAIREGFRFYSYGDAMLIIDRAEKTPEAL
ncbi:MAG: tRNA preQ1(34) S-adenosylmethionine ribosyltransferase-isomerase QueA [Myxococcota bacterium]